MVCIADLYVLATPDMFSHSHPCPFHADTSDMILGFPALTDAYFPLTDPTIPPQDVAEFFATWVSGYYSHGDKAGEYEYQHYVTSPPPTATTMTDEERQSTEHPLPGDARGGSDYAPSARDSHVRPGKRLASRICCELAV